MSVCQYWDDEKSCIFIPPWKQRMVTTSFMKKTLEIIFCFQIAMITAFVSPVQMKDKLTKELLSCSIVSFFHLFSSWS